MNPLTRSALEMTQCKGILGFGLGLDLDEPYLYPSLSAPCKGDNVGIVIITFVIALAMSL